MRALDDIDVMSAAFTLNDLNHIIVSAVRIIVIFGFSSMALPLSTGSIMLLPWIARRGPFQSSNMAKTCGLMAAVHFLKHYKT